VTSLYTEHWTTPTDLSQASGRAFSFDTLAGDDPLDDQRVAHLGSCERKAGGRRNVAAAGRAAGSAIIRVERNDSVSAMRL